MKPTQISSLSVSHGVAKGWKKLQIAQRDRFIPFLALSLFREFLSRRPLPASRGRALTPADSRAPLPPLPAPLAPPPRGTPPTAYLDWIWYSCCFLLVHTPPPRSTHRPEMDPAPATPRWNLERPYLTGRFHQVCSLPHTSSITHQRPSHIPLTLWQEVKAAAAAHGSKPFSLASTESVIGSYAVSVQVSRSWF